MHTETNFKSEDVMGDEILKDPARLTNIYLKMRDKKAEITRAAEAEVHRIEEQMNVVERALLDLMGENTTGLKNKYGTVSRVIKEKIWSSDWEAMKQFALDHAAEGGLDLFEKRLAQNNMREFLEKHPDQVPLGLQVDRRYAIRITRSRTNTGAAGDGFTDEGGSNE